MRKSYSVLIAAALLAGGLVLGGSTVAKAEHVMKSGTDVVEVKLYGQVNRALMYGDNGNDSELFHVDNDNSSTRLGLNGKAKINDNFSTGIKFEAEWQYNPSNGVSFEDPKVDGDFSLRKFELFFDSKGFGKLTMGQGDTASNGTSEVDLSGTSVAGYSDVETWGGGLVFYEKTANASGPSVGSVFNNMDGHSRQDRLRYDSPSLAGFTLSGSAIENSQCDLAARYNGDFEGWKLKGAIAYSDDGDDSDNTWFNGSISVLLDMGINFTFAAGQIDRDPSDRDPAFYYFKLGYLTKAMTDLGKTAFSVDYTMNEDIASLNDEADEFGIQFVQKVDNWGTEFYASYRLFGLDRTGANFDDVWTLAGGARIKF